MVWIIYKKESNVKARVVLETIRPTEEQKANGVQINEVDLPIASKTLGKGATLYINPQTNDLWYEYVDRPLTEQERVLELEQAITAILGGAI